jgi:bifunctional non-homologous end joining protein LigD
LFVVHKHGARRLHYDFRLEIDGVLKSWALPKGPSLAPRQKRLAVQVEDHPLAYADFEGIISEGYGAGSVMLWDQGTWSPVGDPAEGYRQGKLEFTLNGKKLRGGFVLVRMKGKAGKRGANWLLMKRRDSSARATEEGDVLVEEPLSALTGRSQEEIAADHDRTWEGCDRGRERPPSQVGCSKRSE